MSGIRRAPALASDDWLLEQQVRAEMEAEAWRRLRETLSARPEAPQPEPSPVGAHAPSPLDQIDRGGSIILKALVRFALAAFGAYVAWIAAVDGGVGEFEVWLATGAGFLVTLCLSMLDPARRFVHLIAEAMRWALLVVVALGAVWLMVQAQA
jgi:hypothetical protein